MEPKQWLTLILFGLTILTVITNIIDTTLSALVGVRLRCPKISCGEAGRLDSLLRP